ncbi:LPS export ABC transporter permease LptG [Ferrimonas lipolytica]|uniref:LPS export ABC transporter permease LptG n=1 Tax=Ferrimonas lipolytica TaxID=2724191 RepID=A0A6H1UIM8_9GAMM|nr:LPS export ABC transporter permease LptG [Ferrimonas lipolytica]QIZ78965.1 LPS export ABC transporter permease LptG [Ferrimonas lipolytica]
MKILDQYIARTIIGSSTVCLLVLTGLSGLIKFVDKLRWAGKGDFTTWDVVVYVLFLIPRDIETFFPIAAMLGALIGMGMLAQSSELVVMQAAGLSRMNIAMSVLKTALPLMLCVMLIGEYVAPVAEKTAREYAAQKRSGGSLIRSSSSGTWAKDGDGFVNIREVINADHLSGITLYRFDEDNTLRHVTHAEIAQFEGNSWQLSDVTRTHFNDDKIDTSHELTSYWQSNLTPEKLQVVTVKPESLSISGLVDYLDYLDANRQDPTRYWLALWRKVAQPVTVAVMMMLGLSFIFGPLRTVTMGARILLGVITGFSFYLSNEIFGPMSMVLGLPTFLGAMLPSMLFALAALLLLRRR